MVSRLLRGRKEYILISAVFLITICILALSIRNTFEGFGLFESQPKITIVTPCYRQKNIPRMFDSILFDRIDKWIIVYDTSKDRKYDKLYPSNPKIVEVTNNLGISGNPQRNYGMSLVDDGFIYFLDDDNIIHPAFWNITRSLNTKYFYTFDQLRDGNTFYGNTIEVGKIDTAMFIATKEQIGNIKWIEDKYDADGYFISEILKNNKNSHKYINEIGSYYNYLRT